MHIRCLRKIQVDCRYRLIHVFYHVRSINYLFEFLLAIKDDTYPFYVLFVQIVVQMFVWKNHGPVRALNLLDRIWYVPL